MKSLYESLLDIDDIDKDVTTSVTTDWLKTYAKNLPKVQYLKKGIKVWGDLILRNVPDREFPELGIAEVTGNIYIENCAAASLYGLFTGDAACKGSVYITNCPNLKSLDGAPWQISRDLEVIGCKSLDVINDNILVAHNVTIMKCKKRFKEPALRKVFGDVENIYCSEEDDIPNLDEALSDPILIRLWEQVRATRDKYHPTLREIIPIEDMAVDKAAPSYRRTYKCSDKKALKEVLRCMNPLKMNKFAIFESDGRFTCLYKGHFKWCVKWLFEDNQIPMRVMDGRDEVTQDIQSAIDNNETVHIFDFDSDSDLDVYKLRRDRRANR